MAFRKLFTTFNDKHLEAVWHELNRRIQAAIDSTSGAASIVYRQGAQTGGGVYGTWPETVAAAAAIPGVKTVFVDDSLGAPIVGAGLWNLGGYTIMRGRQRGAAGGKCPLSCVDGARLIGVFEFRALRITSASTQPVVTSEDVQASNTGGNPTYVLAEGSSIECTGGAPFFTVDSGDRLVGGSSHWWLADDSELVESTGTSVLQAQSRQSGLVVFLLDAATAQDNTVQGLPNTVAEVVVVNAGATALPQAGATIILAEQASRVAFQGSASPHLGATETQGAIDALAFRLRWGAGSPEGVVTAPPGVLYLDTNGGKDLTLWVKESGVGNTGWVAK